MKVLQERNTLGAIADPSTWQLSQRLVRDYLKPYVWILLGGLACMVVGSACTALLARQMEPVIDEIFIARNAEVLMWVATQVFMIFLFKGVANYGENVAMTYVGERIVATMRKQLISHLLKTDLGFFHNTPSGELISRLTTDVNMLHRVISRTITNCVKDGLTLLFLVILMFYKDWILAFIAFFVFPAAFFPIIRIGRKIRRVSGIIQEDLATYTILLSQISQGMRVIKSYSMEKYEETRIYQLIDKLFKQVMRATRTRSASHPIMEILAGVAIVIVIFYGGWQAIQGTQTSGSFFTFITALLFSYEPMKHLASLNTELQEKLAAAHRVFALLDRKPTIIETPQATPLKVTEGKICFSNIWFSYTPSMPALKNVTLEIPAGKTTALVGISGSGKSTLMNLLLRFYDIQQGKITIDGQDIREVTLDSLRKNSALVSQEVMLFDDSIYNNIYYGRPDARPEEVMEAAKAAAAHDFIESLPHGYATQVGEQGIRLSGGQRQRLAIARAMLKNAPILLLDEATSALDSQSEHHVQQAIQRLMQGRTTLIIAHRLTTIRNADQICLLDGGEVSAWGTHEELLNKSPLYHRLYQAQLLEKHHDQTVYKTSLAV